MGFASTFHSIGSTYQVDINLETIILIMTCSVYLLFNGQVEDLQ